MTPLDAMKQALEYAENQCGDKCNPEYNPCWAREVAEGLKSAIEQMEKVEPVAWMQVEGGATRLTTTKGGNAGVWQPLYTAPIAPEGWQAAWIEKAKAYLESQCGDLCNAEYNPCEAREILKELP